MPRRLQLSRTAGWRMPAGAVKCDRSTRWGNPFRATATAMSFLAIHFGYRGDGPGRQRAAVALHRAWLSGEPVSDGGELSAGGSGTVEYGPGALATVAEVTRAAAGSVGALLLEASDPDWRRTPPSPAEIRAGLAGRDLACWCRLCPAHAGGKPLGTECPDCDPCHVDTLGAIANASLACEEA